MIAAGPRIGWQTTLADLALILFMVTAAAMAETPVRAPEPPAVAAAKPAATDTPVPAGGEPLAIYRAAPGAPSLREWLASQPRDPRQHLTIVARPPAGAASEAARAALALEREAQAAGRSARIVIEPGGDGDLLAVLDFDGRQSGTTIATTIATDDTYTNGAASTVANQR